MNDVRKLYQTLMVYGPFVLGGNGTVIKTIQFMYHETRSNQLGQVPDF